MNNNIFGFTKLQACSGAFWQRLLCWALELLFWYGIPQIQLAIQYEGFFLYPDSKIDIIVAQILENIMKTSMYLDN